MAKPRSGSKSYAQTAKQELKPVVDTSDPRSASILIPGMLGVTMLS